MASFIEVRECNTDEKSRRLNRKLPKLSLHCLLDNDFAIIASLKQELLPFEEGGSRAEEGRSI
jgi:hypothetical protein